MPDGVAPEALAAARVNSTRFWARGLGAIIDDQAEIQYTVRPCPGDDHEPLTSS